MIVLRGLWSLFVATVTLVGVLIGIQIGNWLAPMLDLSAEDHARELLMFKLGLNAVGGLLGFLFALFAFRKLVFYIQRLERVSLLDKLAETIADETLTQIDTLIEERNTARANKDYARGDEIRDQLTTMGIEILDSPEGTTWRKI